MRCDQHMGFNLWAQGLLDSQKETVNETVIHKYKDGREEKHENGEKLVKTYKTQKIGYYYGMFEDKYPLHRYEFQDGRVFEEYVQADPWSSGPVFFIALKNGDGEVVEESLWGQEDIDNA